MNQPRRALYVYSGDGLCNRLMVLLSGYAIAEASQRAFEMDWVPTKNCACPFDQLFEGDWGIHPTTEFDPQTWRDLRLVPPSKFPDFLTSDEPILRLRYHVWLTQPQLYPSHVPIHARAAALWQRFQPIGDIAARIESFHAEFFRPTMIGVHLRRGDFHHARPEIVSNLEDTLKVVDQWLKTVPDAGILLCTDDGAPSPLAGVSGAYHGVREQFQARYGDRVVSTTPRSLDRATPEAIQDAVQDLWLLRRTQFFVGTLESTFSTFAVLGRDVPTRMTGAPTPAYQARQRRLKWTGIYYGLRALGRLEFGANVPHFYLVRVYKQRLVNVRLWLRNPRLPLKKS